LPEVHNGQLPANPVQQAVIDIGSNTVRLVIFAGDPRVPTVVLNEKVQARLGKGVANDGKLSGRSMETALLALRRYALILDARQISEVHTVATAAVRDARNGPDFLARVEELGLKPRLLSGEDEALTSALGVAGAFPGARGVVADLGGGSLELVHINGWVREHGSSLPLGTLRLPGLRKTASQRFGRETEQMIASAGSICQPGEALYLVGGSFRALARYYLHLTGSVLDDPHGFEVDAGAIRKLCNALQRGQPTGPVPGISAARFSVLSDTAALLSALIQATQAERLVFSGWGLREGVILENLSDEQRERDPLSSCARAFARQWGASDLLADRTAEWIASATLTEGHQSLIAAAVSLGLALRIVEPNLRSATAINWALHKRWIGLNGTGRAMLAACLLASVNRSLPADLRKLAKHEEIHTAVAWGMAMRLCWRLSGFAPSLLHQAQLQLDRTEVVLLLKDGSEALVSEATGKDLSQLAVHLGVKSSIRPA